MSPLALEIIRDYPTLESSIRSLFVEPASDSRLMAELASHVVDLFQTEHPKRVQPAFDIAERLLLTGQEADRQVATVGFLETVQNVASHRPYGVSAFEQFLGPQSRLAWATLLGIWKGKTSLAEVVAAETGARLQPRWWQFWRKRRQRTPQELLRDVENPELRRIIEQITRE
jgi:hypothetical protein